MKDFHGRKLIGGLACFTVAVALAPLPERLPALAAPPGATEIDRLIQQLGSPKFTEREAATKALDRISEPALTALQRAARTSDDAEIRRRARHLVTAIESRVYGELRWFQGHSECITALAFLGNGRRFLSGSCDGTIRLWDIDTGQQLRCLKGDENRFCTLAFSPDGRCALCCCRDNTGELWDLEKDKELCRFEMPTAQEWLASAAFSPDGRHALVGGGAGTLQVWDLKAKRALRCLKGHSNAVTTVAFSADGRCAASGSTHGTLRLWELNAARELRRVKAPVDGFASLAFSPDGRRILSGGPHGARLWDLNSGKEVRRFHTHGLVVLGAAFSPDGRRVLSSGGDDAVRLSDVASGQELWSLEGYAEGLVIFSPDGRRALYGARSGEDFRVRLFRLPKLAIN